MGAPDALYDDWKDLTVRWDRYWSLDKHKLVYVNVVRRMFYSMMLDRFLTAIKPKKNDKILDMRCGNGTNLKILMKKGYSDCSGIDCSEVAVKLAKENGLKNVMVANPTKLPFNPGEFKFCFGQGMLEHMTTTDAIKALKESKRVSEYSAFSVPLNDGILHRMQQNGISKKLNLFSLTPREKHFSKTGFERLIGRVFMEYSVHDFMFVSLLGICRKT